MTTPSPATTSGAAAAFTAAAAPDASRSLRFVASSVPWGWVWFLVLALGSLLAVVTLPFGLGLLVGLGALARQGARLERDRIRSQLGLDLPDPERLVTGTWWERLRAGTADPATWRDVAHLFALWPVSTLALGAGVLWCAAALLGVASPLLLSGDPLVVIGVRIPYGVASVIGVSAGLLLIGLARPVLGGLLRLPQQVAVVLLSRPAEELHAEAHQLSRRLGHAERAALAERSRIERDLHDGIQPRLVVLAMDLDLARTALERGQRDRAVALVQRSHEATKVLMRDLRNVAQGIHPEALDRQGLAAALAALGNGATLPIGVTVALADGIEADLQRTAFYVASEGITNALRHSGATHVDVTVTGDAAEVVVVVTDDGHGGAALLPGHGLAGLCDRVAVTGGSLDLDSPSGGPTTLRVRLPRHPAGRPEIS
jgi:signal transduction histidine kinase